MEKKIITISREYGSGGRQIGLTPVREDRISRLNSLLVCED